MRTKAGAAGLLSGLFVFALTAGPAAAQTTARRPAIVDVVGGANWSTLTLPLATLFEGEALGVDISINPRGGFVGGVLIGVPAAKGVVFETGALLSMKGAAMKVTLEGFGTASGSLRMTYLDVPTLGRFRVLSTSRGPVLLLAGATTSFRLHATQKASFMGETISESFTSDVAAVDVGLTFGGRAEVGRGLVDVRYTHGLLNAATESGPDGETIKHRVISFLAGWRF